MISNLKTLAVAFLAATAIANPLHGHRHIKRTASPDLVTVYVDQNGNVIEAPPDAAPAVEAPSSAAPAPAPASSTAPASDILTKSEGNSGSEGSKLSGIVYSPYNGDGTCKSKDQVASDVQKLKNYSPIRTYGVDCQQVQNVLSAAKGVGSQIFAGIFNVENAAAEVQDLISAVGGQWDSVHTVSIGNEAVNSGKTSASALADAINSSRSALRAAGYKGPVVGVDTFVAIAANPVICEASDYVAANCHPFFDGSIEAAGAGQFLVDMKGMLKSACGDKKIMYTETGWPTQGGSNGKAVPSPENQAVALKSIHEKAGSDVILFTAFDDEWKSDNPGTFSAEKHWGIKNLSLQ